MQFELIFQLFNFSYIFVHFDLKFVFLSLKVIKRSRDEFTHQGYPRKEAVFDTSHSPRTTKINRSVLALYMLKKFFLGLAN